LAAASGDEWLCKTRRQRHDECIAVARDLWFEGLGFPHPVNACQGPDPWRKTSIGSGRHQAVAAAPALAPGHGSHDNDQT
jgi:hypothetical protein